MDALLEPGPDGEEKTTELAKGERAHYVLQALQQQHLMLCFLFELGKHYKQLLDFLQITHQPTIHEVYHRVLAFQTGLFNLALEFKSESVDVHDMNIGLASLKTALLVAGSTKRATRPARSSAPLYCLCQKASNPRTDGTMIECTSAGM